MGRLEVPVGYAGQPLRVNLVLPWGVPQDPREDSALRGVPWTIADGMLAPFPWVEAANYLAGGGLPSGE